MYTYYEIETINCLSGIIVRKHKSQKKGCVIKLPIFTEARVCLLHIIYIIVYIGYSTTTLVALIQF